MLARYHRSSRVIASIRAGARNPAILFQCSTLKLASLDEANLPGIAAILARYKKVGIQLTDASLVHLANREGIETIFTLDRRNFGVLRLACGKKFRMIP